jgi:hypothetical protein
VGGPRTERPEGAEDKNSLRERAGLAVGLPARGRAGFRRQPEQQPRSTVLSFRRRETVAAEQGALSRTPEQWSRLLKCRGPQGERQGWVGVVKSLGGHVTSKSALAAAAPRRSVSIFAPCRRGTASGGARLRARRARVMQNRRSTSLAD